MQYPARGIGGSGYPRIGSPRENLLLLWARKSEDWGDQNGSAGSGDGDHPSSSEQHRDDRFDEISRRYAAAGYRLTELTASTWMANIFTFLYGLPLAAISCFLFYKLHPDKPMLITGAYSIAHTLILLAFLIGAHELIHGITWSLFAKRGWKDIDLGFAIETLSPYCKCRYPLEKEAYVTGAIMPLVIAGVIPTAAAVLAGSAMWLLLGIIMTMYAGNDILSVINILKYKDNDGGVLYMEYPNREGGVIFESRREDDRSKRQLK